MVVHPVGLVCQSRPVKSVIVYAIYKEIQVAGIPLQGKNVEIIRESAMWQLVSTTEVSWAMRGSINQIRLIANILHNVNFATCGPANRRTIVTKQPESRPDSPAGGDFDAGFEKSVGKTKMAAGS